MQFRLQYHDKISEDVSRLTKVVALRVQGSIERKLLREPALFGKPLSNSLRGFRSMRVGEYRVVFLIQGVDIFIVVIGHRSIVYKIAEGRA